MADRGPILQISRNLKNAVSAILRGYEDGQEPVTDTSAELHRLCGCLELLLQFDQKEQRSFLGAQKDYWDFLFTTLRRQRGYTEQMSFICSQDKLKTSLGKGRAFIRLCLAHGQLAESMQLCLLNPQLTRKWYGPRSPLLCPELQEDILDSLYALNGVVFNLDLQRPDLDEAWPMFSESHCSSPSRKSQERRRRKPKAFPDEVRHSREEQLQEPDTRGTSCLQDATREDDGSPNLHTPLQNSHLPTFLEEKRKVTRSLSCPQSFLETEREGFQLDQEGGPKTRKFLENPTASIQQQGGRAKDVQMQLTGRKDEGKGSLPGTEGRRTTEGIQKGASDWNHDQGLLAPSLQGREENVELGYRRGWDQPGILGQSLGSRKDSTTKKPQAWTGVTNVTMQEDQTEVPLQQEVIKDPRCGLQLAEEQAQWQEQLWAQERKLQVLREQLSRCQEKRALLQAMLEQKQQEAERRDTMYQKELEGQRDLAQAMKRRVLELIREKDFQWQRVQQRSTVAPGHCMGCSKVFRRLSRRYPCRLCGGLVCHACSVDYKKRERCCPACAQQEEIHVT